MTIPYKRFLALFSIAILTVSATVIITDSGDAIYAAEDTSI